MNHKLNELEKKKRKYVIKKKPRKKSKGRSRRSEKEKGRVGNVMLLEHIYVNVHIFMKYMNSIKFMLKSSEKKLKMLWVLLLFDSCKFCNKETCYTFIFPRAFKPRNAIVNTISQHSWQFVFSSTLFGKAGKGEIHRLLWTGAW